MARIPYARTDQLPDGLKQLLGQVNLNVFNMWAHSVSTAEIVMRLGAAQYASLQLPRSIRELVTLLGAKANAAEYAWVQHVAPSKAAGVTDQQRDALQHFNLSSDNFRADELAALNLALAVLSGPMVSDAIFAEARRHYSDRQLVELVGVIGYYWMLGRITTVFGVDLDVAVGTEIYDAGLEIAENKTTKQ